MSRTEQRKTEFSAQDIAFMHIALEEAVAAIEGGDVPVGAVLVSQKDGAVIAKGRNTRELLQTALGHAELNALEAACAALGTRRLPPCTLYVTLEPCPMCAGAILQTRISRVVFGTSDPVAGAMGSVWALHRHPIEASHTVVENGCCAEECRELLQAFFQNRREMD